MSRDRLGAHLFFLLLAGMSARSHAATTDSTGPDVCPTDTWCFVSVPGTLAGNGSETGFDLLYRSGTTPDGPLLIHLNGGGACWDGDTCDCQWDPVNLFCANPESTIAFPPYYDASLNVEGYTLAGQTLADSWYGGALQTAGYYPGTRIAMFAGPTSPFATGWNFAHIPYTTGDFDSGETVRSLRTTKRAKNITYTHFFMGYSNMRKYLARLKRDFPNPSKVLLTGESAGGIGDHCNLSQVVRTWPNAKIYMFAIVGMPLSPPEAPAVPAVGKVWGTWHEVDGKAIADTCPVEDSPGVEPWGYRNVVHYNATHFPNVRQAFTDDYSDNAMNFAMCILQPTNTIDFCNTGSADYTSLLTSTMLETLNDDINANGPNPNFKVYYHPGLCHSSIEEDGNSPAGDGYDPSCDYDNITESGVRFNDWVRGFAEVPGYSWEDVE
jgi:hypothetical protein